MAAFIPTIASAAGAAAGVYRGARKAYEWASSFQANSRIPTLEKGEFCIMMDPVSTLTMVALMRFKEPETRFGVNGTKFEFQQPSEYQNDYLNWQWLHRTIRGDSRENLALIKDAITFSAKLYKPQDSDQVKELFLHARKGLDFIAATYNHKSELTCSAIDSWKEMIDEACNDGIEPESELTAIAMRVQTLWSETEIKIICDLLDVAAEGQGDTKIEKECKCGPQIKAIEGYLSDKNQIFRRILEEES